MTIRVAVTLEVMPKRTFATAADWPGWSRSGKSPDIALGSLIAYADRYAPIAHGAGVSLPTMADLEFVVDESAAGNATTEFGAPGRVSDLVRRALTAAEGASQARLVAAAWAFLDEVARSAPEVLRKGPRGGGRDTSKILAHIRDAELAYAREIGIRAQPRERTDETVERPADPGIRDAILDVVGQPSNGSPLADRRWTARYAAHRIAWHVLDHAWEIEDRTDPG